LYGGFGYYPKHEYTGFTADGVLAGDKLMDDFGNLYLVKTNSQEMFLDSHSHWVSELEVCDASDRPTSSGTWHLDSDSLKTDSRYRHKTYLDTYLDSGALLFDDGASGASYLVSFDGADYPITKLLLDSGVDLLFSVAKSTMTPEEDAFFYIYKYRESVPITVYAINKSGLTATNLLDQAEEEIRRIVTTYPIGSIRKISRGETHKVEQDGLRLYSATITIEYTRTNDNYAPTKPNITYGHGALYDFATEYGSTVYTATSNGAGDGTTIINTTHTQADDYWNGTKVKMLTGTCAGEECYVSDFTAGTDTLTLAGTGFTDQIDSGDTYLISAWKEVQDGNTGTFTSYLDDYLHLNVSATAGNAIYYVQNMDAIGASTSTYTQLVARYKTGTTITAKIVAVFSDASTQTVLDNTNATTYQIARVTLTAAKTLNYLRVYANGATTGNVFYDFTLVCKGTYYLPNCTSLMPNSELTDVYTPIPGRQGTELNGLGMGDYEATLTCDLSVEQPALAWKRPQTGVATDNNKLDALTEIHAMHNHPALPEPWQWVVLGNGMQFKARLRTVAPRYVDGEQHVDLTVREVRISGGLEDSHETVAEKYGTNIA
jgi:hypothetical protein